MRLLPERSPRWVGFFAANALATLALVALVIVPLVQRFGDRRAAMADDLAETRRIDDLQGRVRALAARLVGPGSPTLPTGDERLGSADLQAALQEIVRETGAGFRGVRGQAASRRADLRLVAARLDIEGPPSAVAATLRSIEDHVPLLWVTSAVLRPTTGGPVAGGPLRAELQIEAALAGTASPRAATSQAGIAQGRSAGGANP